MIDKLVLLQRSYQVERGLKRLFEESLVKLLHVWGYTKQPNLVFIENEPMLIFRRVRSYLHFSVLFSSHSHISTTSILTTLLHDTLHSTACFRLASALLPPCFRLASALLPPCFRLAVRERERERERERGGDERVDSNLESSIAYVRGWYPSPRVRMIT